MMMMHNCQVAVLGPVEMSLPAAGRGFEGCAGTRHNVAQARDGKEGKGCASLFCASARARAIGGSRDSGKQPAGLLRVHMIGLRRNDGLVPPRDGAALFRLHETGARPRQAVHRLPASPEPAPGRSARADWPCSEGGSILPALRAVPASWAYACLHTCRHRR